MSNQQIHPLLPRSFRAIRTDLQAKSLKFAVRLGVLTAAVAATVPSSAGTSTNTAGAVRQGTTTGNPSDFANNRPAITISFSGQTALRNFNTSIGISALRPRSSATFNFDGVPVTYTANATSSANVQLARRNFSLADTGVNYSPTVPNAQQHSALRLEWHEQGSAEGLLDMINDQVGYIGSPLSNVASRGASVANPTWINGTQFQAGNNLNGHFLAAGNYANTYDTTVYDRATGRNLLGAQNRIQFAVGEFKNESFSRTGAPTVSRGAGAEGYGLGNPALKSSATANGLGVAGGRQSFRDESIANLSTDKVDPQSATSQTYASGPWNTAGANNIDSRQIAVTAVPFTANPGTGLRRLNLTDTQWIQTLGRLQNGADFNVATRSADTGQRIVAALNTGVDPSWSVGENDDGNTSTSAAANAQKSIGPAIRFSGKTSGPEARAVIAQSRLGIGPLSLAETRGAASAAPVRTLDVAFDAVVDPTVGGVTDDSAFTTLNFDSIVNGTYKTVLISHYNTIKAPDVAGLAAFRSAFQGSNGRPPTPSEELTWWNNRSSSQTGIKGDVGSNVSTFITNISDSIGTAVSGLTAASVNNPGDALFINGFLAPGLLNFTREVDGGVQTPRTLPPEVLAVQNNVRDNYGVAFNTDQTAGSRLQTIGDSATYGALNAAGQPAINGAIPITAKNADGSPAANGEDVPKGNYLFGNFDQNGKRDFASIKTGVGAALALAKADGAKSSIFTADGGIANGTAVIPLSGSPGWSTTANTKGDLITLGDFNSDGAFDGKDVYLLARGASLSDTVPNATGLSSASGVTFSNQVRSVTARLNKNATLDFAQAQTVAVAGNVDGANAARAFLRTSGRAVLTGTFANANSTVISDLGNGIKTYTNDPAGANAFNKLDVNRDGAADFYDAAIVDGLNGQSVTNYAQQLAAVVSLAQSDGGTVFVGTGNTTNPALDSTTPRRQISLVDAELDDDSVITASDVAVANTALSGPLAERWTAGVTHKIGPNTISFARTAAGSVEVPVGASLRMAGGLLTAGGAGDPFTDNTPAGGAVGTSLAVLLQPGAGLSVTGGAKRFASLGGGGALNVSAGGSLEIAGGAPVVALSGLIVDGAVNLNDNDLVVNYTGGPPIGALVLAAGQGRILADEILGGASTFLALGEAADLGLTTFNGVAVDGTTVIGKYTYAGDANFDGQVTADDYGVVDSTFGNAVLGAALGDLNYDGFVTEDDYGNIDATFGAGVGNPLGGGFAPLGGVSGVIAVPEPSLAVVGLVGAGLLTLRRRSR